MEEAEAEGGRTIPIVLLSLTGGVGLSAINDLAIFHGCSSKAIKKASLNQKIIEALGMVQLLQLVSGGIQYLARFQFLDLKDLAFFNRRLFGLETSTKLDLLSELQKTVCFPSYGTMTGTL